VIEMRKVLSAIVLSLASGTSSASMLDLTFQVDVTTRLIPYVVDDGAEIRHFIDETYIRRTVAFGARVDASKRFYPNLLTEPTFSVGNAYFDVNGFSVVGLDAGSLALLAELAALAAFVDEPLRFTRASQWSIYSRDGDDFVQTAVIDESQESSVTPAGDTFFATDKSSAIILFANIYGEPDTPEEVIVPDRASLTLALFGMLLNQTPLEFVAGGRTLDFFYRDDGGPATYTAVSGVLYQGTGTLTSIRTIPVSEPSSLALLGLALTGLCWMRRRPTVRSTRRMLKCANGR
jgi:hypothetical protein